MMVMAVRNLDAAAARNVGGHSISANGGEAFFPMERVVFETLYVPGETNYEVTNATFYPSTGAAVELDVPNTVLTLGYIGKTGRFVAMSNPRTFS